MQNDAVSISKLKLIRAHEHLNALQSAIDSYARTELYRLVPKTDGAETLEVHLFPPPQIAILVGEVLYHLRSALDYLAFDLVEASRSKIDMARDWERQCEFPLLLKIPEDCVKKGIAPPLPYNCFRKWLPGIPTSAFTFIESLQPYHSGEGRHNILRLLAQLSNIDKHRHLNLLIPKVAIIWNYRTGNGARSVLSRGGLKNGAIIGEDVVPNGSFTNMERSLYPYVTFDEKAISKGPSTLEVQDVMKLCLEQVESVVIPAFDQFLNQPCLSGQAPNSSLMA